MAKPDEEKQIWRHVGTTMQVFAYERSGGRNTELWDNPAAFSRYGGQQGMMLDADFTGWLQQHRLFTREEVSKGTWVKVSDHGISKEMQLQPNGTFTERNLILPKDTESGRWEIQQGVLLLRIGGYDLSVYTARTGQLHSGVEIFHERPNAYFRVIHVL